MDPEVRKADAAREIMTREGCYVLEVANDESDPSLSIARARVPPGGATEWHRLNRTEERYILVSGRGRVDIAGLPPTDVEAGDVVRIPAETPQRITNTGPDDLVFFCVCTPRFRQESYVPIPGAVRDSCGAPNS